MSEETENAIEYLKWSGKPKLASAVAALKEENERLMRLHVDTCIKAGDEITTLKARVAELEAAYTPVYLVATGDLRCTHECFELYELHEEVVPMADNVVLYRKEPANEG